MKNTRWTLLAALVLAVPTVAHAQASRMDTRSSGGSSSMSSPSSGPSMDGSTVGASGAGDSGSISNGTATETTTTTTSTTGISPEGMSLDAPSDTTELANTGGEPILMSLMGLSMMAGAFALRRRVSA